MEHARPRVAERVGVVRDGPLFLAQHPVRPRRRQPLCHARWLLPPTARGQEHTELRDMPLEERGTLQIGSDHSRMPSTTCIQPAESARIAHLSLGSQQNRSTSRAPSVSFRRACTGGGARGTDLPGDGWGTRPGGHRCAGRGRHCFADAYRACGRHRRSSGVKRARPRGRRLGRRDYHVKHPWFSLALTHQRKAHLSRWIWSRLETVPLALTERLSSTV
jgi:hypothetical protein